MKKISLGFLYLVAGIFNHSQGRTPAVDVEATQKALPNVGTFLESDPVKELFSDLESYIADKVTGNADAQAADIAKIKSDIISDVEGLIDRKLKEFAASLTSAAATVVAPAPSPAA